MRNCWIPGLAVIACLFMIGPRAEALSAHTWVGSNGDDGNTGTHNWPFATFAAALSNTAPGGEISVADSGDFGPLTINQSVTIDGGGARASIYYSTLSHLAITITSSSANVVLRNLDLDGGGSAGAEIDAANVNTLAIENCAIHGFSVAGILIGNLAPESITVSDTTITGCAEGLVIGGGAASNPAHVSMSRCIVSLAGVCGVQASGGIADLNDCSITQSYYGITSFSTAVVSTSGCTFSGNSAAVAAKSGGTIRLSNDAFLDNTTAIYGTAGTVMTVHNNTNLGNTTLGTANASSAPF